MAEKIAVGGAARHEAQLRRDGVPLNLTGVTVTLELRKPDRTTASKSTTVLDATTGQVRYDTVAADYDLPGVWRRVWKSQPASGPPYYHEPIVYQVYEVP